MPYLVFDKSMPSMESFSCMKQIHLFSIVRLLFFLLLDMCVYVHVCICVRESEKQLH